MRAGGWFACAEHRINLLLSPSSSTEGTKAAKVRTKMANLLREKAMMSLQSHEAPRKGIGVRTCMGRASSQPGSFRSLGPVAHQASGPLCVGG